MKNFREEAITSFVLENYAGKTKKVTKRIKRIIDYHVARFVGEKDGLVTILKEGEGFLRIDQNGNFLGPFL